MPKKFTMPMLPGIQGGAARPVVESVRPEVNGGRFPVKRIQGDTVQVDATVVVDGHDLLSCEVLFRHASGKKWQAVRMRQTQPGKDRWEASFPAPNIGLYYYTVRAWVDRFLTWKHELEKKFEAGQDVAVVLQVGSQIIQDSAKLAKGRDKAILTKFAKELGNAKAPQSKRAAMVGKPELSALMALYSDKRLASVYDRELVLDVDREKGAFSSWYEFFPRSCAGDGRTHGTFKDAEHMIPYVAEMGFDVIYLPPIHPIGTAFRKGKNNSLDAGPEHPGSPWGIGAKSGGHKAVHPELGTLADFKRFRQKAEKAGMEIALDLAFQCSPDHPYVKQHPEWFKQLPDGSIQYAENPPKKYQDIYPFHFETDEWPALWRELRDVTLFWVKQGVRIFRVDNPHTKAFRFWQWMIEDIRTKHPDVLFLAEAFTRPAMMYHLGKIGFSQSYTYFTWRDTPADMRKYLEELTQTEVKDFYRPNFWPNTPDILPKHLQTGGRPAFLVRVALAATLSSNYGLYGPAYELMDHTPFKEGGEEYMDSEKYELKAWNLRASDSLKTFIGQLNHIRRHNPALHRTTGLRFHTVNNDRILCFTKQTDDRSNTLLVIANMDFHQRQQGVVALGLEQLGLDSKKPFVVEDLLRNKTLRWKGAERSVSLSPGGASANPVEIYRIKAE